VTAKEKNLNTWLDQNVKTMLLNSQVDLVTTIRWIVRDAVKHVESKSSGEEITMAKWMIHEN